MQHLPQKLPDFSQASILVVGDIMLDRYWFGDTMRISPEAPVPIVKINNHDNRPGGAGNVALNIAALGSKIILLGMVGEDEAAQVLSELLTSANVAHDLCTSATVSTIVKLRVISKHQQLLRLDFEETIQTKNQDLVTRFESYLDQVDLVILSDYKKGTISHPQTLIHLAKKKGVPVLVDPKGSDFSIYQKATIVTPNFKEFTAVVGPCLTEQDIISKGRALLLQHQITSLLVTRGEDGMTLIEEKSAQHFPAYAQEVFDVTGAGDTVIGVLGASVAAKESLLHSAALANLAASMTIGKLGAATVSAPELQVALTGKTSFVTGIVSQDQLVLAVKEARAKGKKIVFTNGCFDVLHAGHVSSLQMAKQLGDFLIVAVNIDETIQKIKGPHRPINPLEHRMIVLAGLEVVDWVVPFAEETPENLLKLIKPDLLVKGADYNLDQVVGADIVRAYGGEVRLLNYDIKTSSSTIIQKMQPVLSGES